MTVRTLKAAMPPVKVLAGMQLRLEAVSPTTGSDVAGVSCTRWAIYGDELSDASESTQEALGPLMLVPGPQG